MEVKFVKSSDDLKTCPPAKLPEFAFIGRSNVGKSSLINLITGIRDLAKISSKPGKTQLINHFLVDQRWALVDLPGYGYARTSKEKRAHFDVLIKSYIANRTNLNCLFTLIDSRLEPQTLDLEFISFLGTYHVPFALVFTKTDKISKLAVERNINRFTTELLKDWETLPQIFKTSIVEKSGKDDILAYIESIVNTGK